ncbi:MAG: efflux RND transporter periplasmic adaptor subunit [Cyclobacteriaceae bacterium]|nr:efflux RND transporter periplasmic adaptor subunit [Cyclobacteriaceae bacterium]
MKIKRSGPWKGFVFLLAGLAFLQLNSCSSDTKDNSKETTPQIPKQVNIVQATGKVLPEGGIANLSAQNGGIVQTVLVQSGDKVAKGQVLVQLETTDAEIALENIKRQIATQRTRIQSAIFSGKEIELKLKQLENDLASDKRLLAKGAVTQEKVSDTENEIDIQKTSLEVNNKSVEVNKLQLAELETQLDAQRHKLESLYLRAPSDGTVMDMNVNPGDAIQPLGSYASFSPAGPLVIEAEADEIFADKIKIGQSVDVKLIGYPDVLATGKVTQADNFLGKKSLFSGESSETIDTRVRKLKISIVSNNGNLLIGTKVNCVIKI